MEKEQIIKKLATEFNMTRIEAECEIARYNREAEERFIESLDCEVI